MLSKLCTGWDAPSHRVLRVQTVEITGLAILSLCPGCLQNLEADEYLGDDDTFFEVDEHV